MSALLGLTIPVPDWPVIGNNAAIAVLFSIHIAIAQFTAGCITVAPFAETYAHRTGSPPALRYAQKMTNLYYLLFSFGATWGIFAVTGLIGLFGADVGVLFNRLLPLMGFAFGSFFITVPALVVYKNTWEKLSPRLHNALGYFVMVWQNLFIVAIVGLDAFLIDPGHTGFAGPALDAPYGPLLVHRLIANVSWATLFLAGFAAVKMARSVGEEERTYQAWAARLNLRIGMLTAAVIPWDGLILVETIKSSSPGFFDNLVNGSAAWLMVAQESLLLVVLVGGNLALALERSPARGRGDVSGPVMTVVCLLGMAVAVMPAQVITPGILWLRYAGLGLATVVTIVHFLARTVPARAMPRLSPAPGAAVALPYAGSTVSRRALVLVGFTALVLTIFMGYIKEQARGQYAIYGELTQKDAHGQYLPGPSIYP